MKELVDLGVFCLLLAALTSTFGFCLFAWEWKRKGDASVEFIYITLIFLFVAFTQWMHVAARVYSILNPLQFECLLDSFIWKIRSLPVTIAIGLICFRMMQRIKNSRT